jgi:succinate dehydrogenase / fumarate reductase cytochrome b subunit
MTETRTVRPRPLSPHLQIYKPLITWVPSITHRLTGIGLGAGMLLVTAWLVALATGPRAFAAMHGFLASWIGILLLVGFTWALMFHLLNGIRHLAWDVGYGFEVDTARITGWTVVIGSFVLTVLVWVLALCVGGQA